MARYYEVGGQRLYDDQVPFAPGSDSYYRYVATWRAKQLGVSYDAPRGFGDGDWERRGGNNARNWWADQADAAKGLDRAGQQARGYVQAMDPVTGQMRAIYDANGNGAYDEGELAGKYGGAGNRNPAAAVDNRWSDTEGQDVRTDEQKFYDRDLTNFAQVADATGNYDWYADWSYRDGQGGTQKKRINLDVLGERAYDGKNGQYSRRDDATYDGLAYWNYNDAPDKSFFDDAVRNRKNLSVYARTA